MAKAKLLQRKQADMPYLPDDPEIKNRMVGLNNSVRELYHEAKEIHDDMEPGPKRVHFQQNVLGKIKDIFTTTKMY